MTGLIWLPDLPDWRGLLKQAEAGGPTSWAALLRVAHSRLDFVRTNRVDAVRATHPAPDVSGKPVRLAILGSCTLTQLHAGIRVAGLRRALGVTIYEADFGQYWQELTDPHSALHAFEPNTVLFALDAHHLAAGVHAGLTAAEVDAALAGGAGPHSGLLAARRPVRRPGHPPDAVAAASKPARQ